MTRTAVVALNGIARIFKLEHVEVIVKNKATNRKKGDESGTYCQLAERKYASKSANGLPSSLQPGFCEIRRSKSSQ